MPSPNSPSPEKKLPFTEKTPFRNYSDGELVKACVAGNRPAWDEFFKRFIPYIKGGIRSVFVLSGLFKLVHDDDVLWNIHEKIVVKLYKKGLLAECRKPSRVGNWLWTVAGNQTWDWLKERGRIKRLPETQAERTNISLSKPLGHDSDRTVGDIIPAENEDQEWPFEYLRNAVERLRNIDMDTKLWVLRLSIISQMPLSQREVEKLSEFSEMTLDEIESRIGKISKRLEQKEKETIKAFGRSVVLWHEIRRNEAILSGKTEASDEERAALADKIRNKTKRREELLITGRRLCRPSNKEIGELIGLPEDKVSQVSNLLIRARNAMIEEMDGIELGGKE